MEIDLTQFGKNYILFTRYLFNVIILFGAVFIALLFLADEETVGIVFLAAQVFSGLVLFLLPVGIVLAIIAKTRKLGGAFLYFVASVSLAYWWIAGLLILQQKGGNVWAIVEIVLSFFTSGFGLFLVTVINAILHHAWTGVLMFIGIPLICKGVMNFSKALMEIIPLQIEEKIKLFEKEQGKEIQAMDEKIDLLEAEQIKREKQLALIDQELEEYDEHIEDDFDDEDWDENYDELDEEQTQAEIERLEKELHKAEKELEEAQKEQAKARGEMVGLMFENRAIADAVYEVFEKQELEEGSAEKYSRDAQVQWRKGNREIALLLYSASLTKEPDDAITLMNRGNLQIEIGNYEEGIADLEKASEINPTLPTHNAAIFKMLSAEMREDVRQKMLEKDNK